jgi:diadenylate cyclase
LIHRLTQLYESLGPRDLVQIAILAVVIYAALHLLGRTVGSGSSIGRGLGLVIVVLFLLGQVVIAAFDLTALGKVLDYVLTTALIALVILFQPELRRGLIVLGRVPMWRHFVARTDPFADQLADAAEALARECVGALIAIEREVPLAPYSETGERLDAAITASLIRCVFSPRSPLHDGAVILSHGRVTAAACQLPLTDRDGRIPERIDLHLGMRHRAALCLSDETDAIVLVVSEETGRISLAVAGALEPVPRENLSRRLAALLSAPANRPILRKAS